MDLINITTSFNTTTQCGDVAATNPWDPAGWHNVTPPGNIALLAIKGTTKAGDGTLDAIQFVWGPAPPAPLRLAGGGQAAACPAGWKVATFSQATEYKEFICTQLLKRRSGSARVGGGAVALFTSSGGCGVRRASSSQASAPLLCRRT